MARGAKSQKIKVLTKRDINLIKQLSRTGLSNSVQAEKYCKLSKDRLNKLEKSGYIKTSSHVVRGKNNLILQLDKQGKELCRQEFGVTNFCISQTNHLYHDLKLTEIYYNLDEQVQETWRHEGVLIKEIEERYPEYELKTCVDAVVQINNEIVAIESIGTSYTSKDMELKQEISTKLLGCSRMESA